MSAFLLTKNYFEQQSVGCITPMHEKNVLKSDPDKTANVV